MKKKVFGKSFLEEFDQNEDGFFKITRKNNLALLQVKQAKGDGEKLTIDSIFSRVKLFGIDNYDEKTIKQVFNNADAHYHEIGKWPQENPVDTSIEIKVSDSQLQALVSFTKPLFGGLDINIKKIKEKLKKESIIFGIQNDVLEEILKKPIYDKEYLIAKGDLPQHGKNSEINLNFIHEMKPRFVEDSQGNIDLKEMGLYQSVKKHDILATMEAPSTGKDGKDIFGNLIKCKMGEVIDWNLGKNASLSSDKKHAIANITGRPILTVTGQIRVDEVIRLDAIDYSTGNIDFVGTIIVDEKIADGFKLQTQGSIIIKQSIGKVNLKAKGDIILAAGFMGGDTGVLESDGDIIARFVERGKLKAQGSIYISDVALHSTLIASKEIEISGRRGEFIGGEAITAGSFFCHKLGTRVETKTKVYGGIPEQLLIELDKIQNSIFGSKETLEEIEKNIKTLAIKKNHNNIDKEEAQRLEKLGKIRAKYLEVLKDSQEQYDLAINNFTPIENASIRIEEVIFPGVDINLGKSQTYKIRVKPINGKSIFSLDHEKKIQRLFN